MIKIPIAREAWNASKGPETPGLQMSLDAVDQAKKDLIIATKTEKLGHIADIQRVHYAVYIPAFLKSLQACCTYNGQA